MSARPYTYLAEIALDLTRIAGEITDSALEGKLSLGDVGRARSVAVLAQDLLRETAMIYAVSGAALDDFFAEARVALGVPDPTSEKP